jgi:hypothetical protein
MSEAPFAGSGLAPTRVDEWEPFLASVRARAQAVCATLGDRPALFTTAAADLYSLFLEGLPEALRQEHRCTACRRFFARYGGVVAIDAEGRSTSLLWDPASAPANYAAAVRALTHAVSEAPVDGVFLASDAVWGTPDKGGWTHLGLEPPAVLIFPPSGVKTRWQVVAEKREDYKTLVRGLEEFPVDVVQQAAALLGTEALYRSEKCLGVAEWLLGLHQRRAAARGERRRENLTWLAVATAPPGFCHVRSTMIGTLLEDLALELPFDEVKERFAAKMHPLQYQRPTAAPSAQNIARAEKIVEQLKTAGALARRFAKLADLETLWTPAARARAGKGEGVFSHLKPRAHRKAVEVTAPPTVMTWDKFSRTVLPDAAHIEYLVPESKESYGGMVTAANPEAPPIIQWDTLERRNPVTWYVYVNGSLPAQWNLRTGTHHPVAAIAYSPAMWGAKTPSRSHHGLAVMFVLEGAKDTQYARGAGFFPEFLKSEYHEIRATMEAYATSAVVEGKNEAGACGIILSKGVKWGHTFRVTTRAGVTLSYTLDRWD